MDKLEKVELVREKSGCSYEDARNALELCDYDILDALVLLEKQGKAAQSAAHFSAQSQSGSASSEMAAAQEAFEQSSKKTKASEVAERLVEGIKHLCAWGLKVSFVVERKSQQIVALPVLILAILVLFLFPATLPLLILGLFFDFRYRFEGLDSTSVDINDVMGKAADHAESFKQGVMKEK